MKFGIRLTLDEEFEIEADSEEDAIEAAWNKVTMDALYGVYIEEIEDEDEE